MLEISRMCVGQTTEPKPRFYNSSKLFNKQGGRFGRSLKGVLVQRSTCVFQEV